MDHGSIARSASPQGLLTRSPFGLRVELLNISEDTAFLLQGVTENDSSFYNLVHRAVVFSVTNLKYGNNDITSEKINNKRLIDRAKLSVTMKKVALGRYNWIADYTIFMLVHKITRIIKISKGLLANQNADSEYNVK